MPGDSLNHKVSRVYELCIKMWPVEFQQNYAKSRDEFNAWLNDKTGLNEDAVGNKSKAVLHWLDELEIMLKNKE